MRKFALPVGLVGFLALLAAGILWVVPDIERDLIDGAEEALRSNGIENLEVSFDGRNGELTGVATADDAQRADAIVETVDGVRWVTVYATAPPTTAPPLPPPGPSASVRAFFNEENQMYVLSGELASDQEVTEMVDRPVALSPVVLETSGLLLSSQVVSDASQIAAVTELVAQMARAAEPNLVFENDTVNITGNITQEGAESELNAAIEAAERAGLRVVDNTSEFDLAQQIDELDRKIKQALEQAQEEALENDIGGEQAFFEFSQASLSPVGMTVLDRVGVSLKQYPLPPVMIVGHTDKVGSPDSNLILSEGRARVAADYLIAAGARSTNSLTSLGRGEKDLDVPDIDEATVSEEELASRQRRIEFMIGQTKVDALIAKNEAGS